MAVEKRAFRLDTQGNTDILDITSQVTREVEASGIRSGVVTLFVSGSTAGLTTIEYEPGLLQDLREAWEKLVPQGIPYHHDRRWGDGNGHAHVRASLLGPSLSVPFVQKRLLLGTWQQIVLIDFDNRPRSREVVLQILGEP
ncbi:MAG: YjbQ family protein [Candidatus Tectomicrobia bacterium]|uniref:YjbQ family protein n=1 Tax=Tectimicrobiota bacterium TaxID=2528274 RepID=A0A932CLM7_UNCTE|nr:YjbQ family protein [Candidatus Tectomicrobia bacterium]